MRPRLKYPCLFLALALSSCAKNEEVSAPVVRECAYVVSGVCVAADDIRSLLQLGVGFEQSKEVLIREAALAAKAKTLGYSSRSADVLSVQHALVDLERGAKIDVAAMKKAVEDQVKNAKRPEMRIVSHWLFTGAMARSRAQRALAEFQHDATAAEEKYDADDSVKKEDLPRFDIEGKTKDGALERAFARSAFELNSPGFVDHAVQTKYGFHVVKVKQLIPASQTVSRAEIEKAGRAHFMQKARGKELKKSLEQMENKLGVERMGQAITKWTRFEFEFID